MIEHHQVIPLLLEASPSFLSAWEKHCREHGDNLLYVAMGDLARHLLRLHQSGQTGDLIAVAKVIERLHLEGAPAVKELATIGILEGIQNNWDNDGVPSEQFATYLLPESARWWQSLNDFWEGKIKYVGERL